MNDDSIMAGQTVSHYRLLGRLGEGGMGIVFIAEDTRLHRQVAIKFLNAGRDGHLSRARFLREARAASVLNHPNVATVYDYGETDEGRPFIVMELLRGQTLSELLDAGDLTIERSVTIIKGVLNALAEAHKRGIVHRDIKPSNIILDERGEVKVLDFGLAKSLEKEGLGAVSSMASADLPTRTLNGAVLGTPLYVSPEQATGTLVDQRSDLFSVGAVLYECLAGRPAFAAPSVVEIFAQVISPAQPPPPSRYNQAVPPALDRIALKALTKSPPGRFQTAEEFHDTLRGIQLALTEVDAPPRHLWGSSLDALYRKIVSRGNERRYSLEQAGASSLSRAGKARQRLRSLAPLFTLGVSGLLLLLLVFVYLRASKQHAPVDSVAVLPFVNGTRDESAEYLSDGLTDALISSLSTSPDLRVISYNSITRFKGQEIDPVAVGSALNVQSILTGSISKAGAGLRVVIELIDTRDRRRIWGKQYAQDNSDIHSLEEKIARDVAVELHRKLGDGGKVMLNGTHQINSVAYDHYVKGRWYWNKRTGEGLRQAIQHFQQAIDLDPDFALAYSGLADAHVLAGGIPPHDSYIRAKAAAARALELDDTLGEAHATLGFIKTHYERDWTNAEAEFKRALELSPNYATAHHWYAAHLLARGQFDSALRELKLAQELDPLSPIINTDLTMYYFYTRKNEQAIGYLEKNRDLFPIFFLAHYHLGWAYTQEGKYAEAVSSYQQALSLSNRHSMVLAMLGYTYAVSGEQDKARQILEELNKLKNRQYVSPYRFAIIYTGLGEKDLAFTWLNKAYDELDILLIYANVSPFSDTLRQDPRFAELIHKLGLSPNNGTPQGE